jgi:hypothetical protein
MMTIHIPLSGAFDCKIIELADRFQEAKRGDEFKLCLYDTGTVTVDAALAFYDVVWSRLKGIRVHIYSHVCLMGSDVLIWLAGDTRTLRGEAWVHFREYPRHWLERTEMQKFTDSLEGRDLQLNKTPFQENYLTVERLVKKHLPTHLWNRRIWGSELAEWNITQPVAPVGNLVEPEKPAVKKTAVKKPVTRRPVKISSSKPTQLALF